MEHDGSMFPGTALLTNDALRAQFAEGHIGMFMGEFWDVAVLTDQFPAKCDWGVAPIPTYDGKFHGKARAMVLSGLWNINGQSHFINESWEVVKWFSRYEVRAKLYEGGKNIDPDPVVVKKYVKKVPQSPQFKAFAGTLDQDYLATYPLLPGWAVPSSNPCTVYRDVLRQGGEIYLKLENQEQYWNSLLDRYYKENPDAKRGWNIYPQFSSMTGRMGEPLVRPRFNH
jgi:multiple sugar transport system substrate-binding protein